MSSFSLKPGFDFSSREVWAMVSKVISQGCWSQHVGVIANCEWAKSKKVKPTRSKPPTLGIETLVPEHSEIEVY